MTTHTPDELLRPLRDVIATGDQGAILDALPEPPIFLQALFQIAPADRDAILAGVFPVLETDEDRWEIIEAAAMDTAAHPERGAFVAITPFIPASLIDDTRTLVASIHDMEGRRVMERAVEERAAHIDAG